MDGHVNIDRDDKLAIVEDAGSKGRKRKRRSQSQEDAGSQVGWCTFLHFLSSIPAFLIAWAYSELPSPSTDMSA